MTTPQKQDDFLDLVQLHERAWGVKSYVGKPSLAEILQSPLVVFWKVEGQENYTISLHKQLREIEVIFLKMLTRSSVETPKKRLMRVYLEKKKIVISDVKIEFKET